MKDKKHFLDPHQHHLPPFSPSPSPAPTSNADGPTIELPRRRRGRPPGSKNKPKPPSSSSLSVSPSPSSSASPLPPNPLIPSMRTLLLQIDPDNDVVDSITRFCRNKSISLSLLSASGTLSHFTLHQPSSPPSALNFRGRFDILSLSATIVSESNPGAAAVNNNSVVAPSSFFLPSGFAVTVSGPQGQVVGGTVGGPLIAAGPVFVVAASFDKPSYHRLPEIEEDEGEGEVAGSGGVGGGFGCHIGSGGSDVVWAPVAARPPY